MSVGALIQVIHAPGNAMEATFSVKADLKVGPPTGDNPTGKEEPMRFWLPALVAIAVLPASAHHPTAEYYDASRPSSMTGQIIELRDINPHVVLIVDGTAPDGRTGRWAFEGSAPNALVRRQKDFKERLKVGTKITISGWPAKDPQARAFNGGTVTFGDGTMLVLGEAPNNRWQCAPGPCQYTYPVP